MVGPNSIIFWMLALIVVLLIIVVARMLNRVEDLIIDLNKTRYENVVLKKLLDNNGIEWRSGKNGEEIKR